MTVEIPMLPHNEIIDVEGYAPTCTEPGLSAGSHCADCNTVISVQEELPALGHDVMI